MLNCDEHDWRLATASVSAYSARDAIHATNGGNMLQRKTLTTLVLIAATLACASAWATTYTLNVNDHRGTIELTISGDTCTGEIHITRLATGRDSNQRTPIKDCRVTTKRSGVLHIVFERVSAAEQIYHGWTSGNGRVIAGYLKDKGGDRYPWFAERQ